MARIARLVLALFLPVAAGAQQTIILRDGTQLNGRVTQATDNTIIVRDQNDGMHTIDFDRLESIRFEHGNAPPSASEVPRGNESGLMALPSGTAISVRSNEAINTQSTTESRSFAAQVTKDVVDPGGNLAIPRGSAARLVVRRLNDGVLALDLQSVSVNGRRYLVDPGNVAPQGGSAFIGTLTGAVAGGGKGAAIGALAGGAVGIGTEIATRGPIIRVPAETVLNFRLDNTMSLQPAQ